MPDPHATPDRAAELERRIDQLTALIMDGMNDAANLSPSERETMARAKAEYVHWLYTREGSDG